MTDSVESVLPNALLAKPSPDSATPTSSSSVALPSLPPDDAAVHNARQGVISALPGTADRSKALDELVRAEMEDGTYWRIPCDCSKSHRSECKRCAGKGWLDARAATTGKGEQGDSAHARKGVEMILLIIVGIAAIWFTGYVTGFAIGNGERK